MPSARRLGAGVALNTRDSRCRGQSRLQALWSRPPQVGWGLLRGGLAEDSPLARVLTADRGAGGGDGPGPEEVALISCAGHPALAAQGSGGALLSGESGCCPGRCGRTKFSCSRRRILTSDQTYLTKG